VHRRIGLAFLAAVLVLAACDSGDDTERETVDDESGVVSAGEGYADDEWFRERQDDYLAHATEDLDPSSILNVVAHFERAARDETFTFDAGRIGPDAFAEVLAEIDGFEDTTDFDVLYLLNLWYGYGDQLPDATRDAIRERLLGFKYWYTEPTPDGVVDQKWYWSENHRIIFHVDEYLAGHAFPDETFTNDGRTGAEHARDAEARIREWLEEKVRFGFTEWHSDVYYQKDVTPLLTLVEFAPDEDLANRAAMLLDVVLFDLALHLHEGNFGATHGRSYMKDKSTALDQDTFGLAKLLFDDTDEPYQSRGDAGATLLARAREYRLPEALRRVAAHDEPMIDREHMNVPLDPLAPASADPAPPYGIAFDDPANVPFWWERGAHVAWQVVPLTIETLDRHELWDSDFFSPFKPLRDLVGDDMAAAQSFAQSLAPLLNFGLLSEVFTYTYRSGDVMLSTAQDYRPFVFGEQYHAWQATLDEHAIVFTTHPKNEPIAGTQWPDRDGYWTGTGSVPRAAQVGTTGLYLYAPMFAPQTSGPLAQFTYLPYTHAYFPTEHFDEVVSEGSWTIGRRGDGYVALWSWRPVHWREHDPAVVFTRGLTQPFDLVADGGPDNVWIVEVGDAASHGSFAEFRAAIAASAPEVAARPPASTGLPGGFDVQYRTLAGEELAWSTDGPLTAGGAPVELQPADRFDNPFLQVPFEGRRYEISASGASLVLDFDDWTRRTALAPAP
jgi:hypothetical protein